MVMLNFLAENWGSLLIGLVIAVIVVLIAVKLCRDRKKGRTSCGCGCDHCPSSGMCHKK